MATAASPTQRLRRSDPATPGIKTLRRGRGVRYLAEDGEQVTDEAVLQRIAELVIPPAWKDVWICPYPGGHIQVTGIDERGPTVIAAIALAVTDPSIASKSARKRAIMRAVKEVAYYLGNTPTVARASYIDPRVFDRYRDGATIRPALGEIAADSDITAIQGPAEQAVLDLLDGS